jgi:hypothetical protein
VFARPFLHHVHDEAIGLRHRCAETGFDPRQAKLEAKPPLDLGQADGSRILNHPASSPIGRAATHAVCIIRIVGIIRIICIVCVVDLSRLLEEPDRQESAERAAQQAPFGAPALGLSSPLMRPPDRISASPLPSYASRPGFLPRPTTLGQALREIALWWRNQPLSFQERMREAKRVARFAEEIDEEWPKQNGPWEER